MTFSKKVFSTVAIGGFLSTVMLIGIEQQAGAQYYSKRPMQAAYDINSSSNGASAYTVYSDGQGRGRIEITPKQTAKKMVMIMDSNKGVMYMIMEGQGTAMESPLKADSHVSLTNDEMAKLNKMRTPLGTKVVDGHPCHGWRVTNSDNVTNAWMADDIDCLVYSETAGPGSNKSTMRLRNYAGGAQSASLFSVPSGYKIMNIGAMGASYGAGYTGQGSGGQSGSGTQSYGGRGGSNTPANAGAISRHGTSGTHGTAGTSQSTTGGYGNAGGYGSAGGYGGSAGYSNNSGSANSYGSGSGYSNSSPSSSTSYDD